MLQSIRGLREESGYYFPVSLTSLRVAYKLVLSRYTAVNSRSHAKPFLEF